MRPLLIASAAMATVLFAIGAAYDIPAAEPAARAATRAPFEIVSRTSYDPDRTAFFGDLHLHTSYSFDAYMTFGARVNPDEAYRFARGEAVLLNGVEVRRDRPLDFAAVTDHSEYLGTLRELEDPSSAFSKSDLGARLRAGDPNASGEVWTAWGQHRSRLPGFDPAIPLKSAWAKEIEAANKNYRPGAFTTFIAYEWTSHIGLENGMGSKGASNLHRNVFFKGDRAPLPFTALDSVRPEDLWKYLESNRQRGMEAIAIPHNGNASNGLMYDWVDSDGRAIDKVYAARRSLNEPLSEIGQVKGQSETHPALSPNDEFANFELDDFTARPGETRKQSGSYIRDAYGRGLVIARGTGSNPYKFGVNGGTDIHNGISTSAENAIMTQSHGGIDPSRRQFTEQFRKFLANAPSDSALRSGSGNLTGVWAEQNTRDSLFAAFRRKETFATSGTWLKIRFFGGWNFGSSLLRNRQWVKTAYKQGVPMGSDLPSAPPSERAPTFVISAAKDPDGANLDRVQVIKVWLDKGGPHQKLFDVALSGSRKVDPKTGKAPPVGNTVDLKTARYSNSIGAAELKVLWRDPEFDPSQPALYYVRVLEIPTPRWTTIQSVRTGLPLPKHIPATIQERGWSSPIWYTPAEDIKRPRGI